MIEVNNQARITFNVRSLVVLLLAVVATLAAVCAATPTQESTAACSPQSRCHPGRSV
jgi:hypothetical protein